MLQRIRVGILFGGKSAEHEVSLQSARNVIAVIDRKKYEPVLIGIGKDGRWHSIESDAFLSNETDPKHIGLSVTPDPELMLAPGNRGKISAFDTQKNIAPIDVIFPVLHGTFGEDGTVQGLLELADIPFVGSGVLGSAVGMDKDAMKRLLRDAGIPIGKFLAHRKQDLPTYEYITEKLGTPFFVKPANAGSSIGVSKVRTEEEFRRAVDEAFLYDTKIILEEMIHGREIECAVLGNDDPIASVPGEVILHDDFYSYETKYLNPSGATIAIPAKLSKEEAAKIQALAIRTFQVLFSEGLGRVDVFLKENGEILVNEINTMPGFTSISMYPKLFEASGISYPDLIDRLITLAFERFERESRLKTSH